MAMWRAAARQLVDRALGSRAAHTSAGSKKIVGVFYKAGEYADKNPNFVGCVERALGIRDWLESQGHHYIVTDDKEGLSSEFCWLSNGWRWNCPESMKTTLCCKGCQLFFSLIIGK